MSAPRRGEGRSKQRRAARKRIAGNSQRVARAGRTGKSGVAKIMKLAGDGTMRFVIPSDFNPARDVQKQILDAIEDARFDGDCHFAIKLALEEALINAIKHGNKFDPEKNVHIEATVTPGQAIITIEDEGPGFVRCDVPDPTLEENLIKCSGRGILLMEHYMDEVSFSKDGRKVRMVKRNK